MAVCEDSLHLARRQGHNRYRVYGQQMGGMYLLFWSISKAHSIGPSLYEIRLAVKNETIGDYADEILAGPKIQEL